MATDSHNHTHLHALLSAEGLLVSRFLLLSPLPLEQDGQEVPEVELGPETLEEEDLCVLVALPEHEIAQSLHTTRANEHVKRRTVGRVHVAVEGVGRYAVDVGINCNVAGGRRRRG
jgi:hypothetical protein